MNEDTANMPFSTMFMTPITKEMFDESFLQRFESKVDKTGDCWTWKPSKSEFEYGQIYFNGKLLRAHRVSYVLAYGPIPKGLVLDHLCAKPNCVRPEHLEAVTHKVNINRCEDAVVVKQKAKTHCIRGHLLPALRPDRPWKEGRGCMECIRWRNRVRYSNKKFGTNIPIKEELPVKEELRRKICSATYMKLGKREHYLDEYLAIIEAENTQKQLEVRIDEVKKLNGLNSVYNMSLSSRHKIYNYINDRIAELTTQESKS